MKEIQRLIQEFDWELGVWKATTGKLLMIMTPDQTQMDDMKRLLVEPGVPTESYLYLSQLKWMPFEESEELEFAMKRLEKKLLLQSEGWRQSVWEEYEDIIDKFGDYS